MIGCLGCAVAPTVLLLNLTRAVTGIGGGGLMTMATIINSDLIPFRRRGMYQAVQNMLNGFGAICGASLGGLIADRIGWRWCFMLQVPISLLALGVGYFAIKIPEKSQPDASDLKDRRPVWQKVDIAGSVLLLVGLSVQLLALSLGGNELPWNNRWVITTLIGSVILLGLFVLVEAKTKALPIIPLRMLRGFQPITTQFANIFFGMAAYAVSVLRYKPSLMFSDSGCHYSSSSRYLSSFKLSSENLHPKLEADSSFHPLRHRWEA